MSNPLEILWIGRATIYEYQEITEDTTCQTRHELVAVIVDEPCRLSHRTELTAIVSSGAPYVTQTIVLFIRPDITIKEGSVIEVTQNNVTNKYKRASKSSVYSKHQEITLDLYEDNA